MDRPYDVMVAGHLCLDVIPRFMETGAERIEDILRPGKLVQTGAAKISTGGPVSNTGINMKTLGNNVCFCARIGDDAFGKLTLDILKKAGNADGVHVVEKSASSYTIVVAPPGIDRIFLHNPGTNDEFSVGDLDPTLIQQCRHFHFGYPPLMKRMFENEGMELEQVFRTAKEAGATTSLDMALPDTDSPAGKAAWKRILQRVLPYVDIFLPSIEEAFFMLEPDTFLAMKEEHEGADLIAYMKPEDYSRIADSLLTFGTKVTSLKSGRRGFYVKTAPRGCGNNMETVFSGSSDNWQERELWAPAISAPTLASATGSGDSSIAGFLTALLKGLSIEECIRAAVCLGWQNLQELDAISGIQSWPETRPMIKKRLPLINPDINSVGWAWSESDQLWSGPSDRKNKM